MSGPIPLGQADTGGNGGMIMALAVCCMCSSSSGIAGFLFRDKISAAMGGGGGSAAEDAGAAGAAVGVAASRSPRPSAPRARAVKRIRIKRKPRRIARKIRKVFRRRRPKRRRPKRRRPSRRPKRSRRIFGRRRRSKRRRPSRRRRRVGRRVGRGAVKVAKLAWKYHPKNVVKRAALRAFNKSRVGKKFNRSRFGKRMNRGIKKAGRGIRRLFRRRRCFAPNTPILLKNGDTRCIKDIELGDVLVNGSVVKATMEILNENDVYYKLPGDILVTGSHYVKDGDTFKQVKNIEKAERTDTVDKIVHCLVTSDHKIPVGDYVFWDWEDNLIV